MNYKKLKLVDKIFCINLDRRPDKWNQVAAEFAKHNLEVERYSAVDGRLLLGQMEKLKSGLFGCNLSHYDICYISRERNYRNVLVFEDDAVLHDDFASEFNKCVSELPGNWEMLYLGGSHKESPVPVSDRILRARKTLTTHAILINSIAINKILESQKICSEPIDGIYASFQTEGNCYITEPVLSWQRAGFSDIEERNMDYPWIRSNKQ